MVDLGDYVAQYLLFGVIAALILLPAVFGEDGGGLWRRVLRHRSLVWLGLVSYGIFLWQFPVLIFLLDAGVETFVPLTLLTFTITVGCAAVSYYLLERPLMRRVRCSRGSPSEPRLTSDGASGVAEEPRGCLLPSGPRIAANRRNRCVSASTET